MADGAKVAPRALDAAPALLAAQRVMALAVLILAVVSVACRSLLRLGAAVAVSPPALAEPRMVVPPVRVAVVVVVVVVVVVAAGMLAVVVVGVAAAWSCHTPPTPPMRTTMLSPSLPCS